MSIHDDNNREIDIDLGRVFGSIWRCKGKILLASLIATAIAFLILQTIKPRYQSEARILIRPTTSVLSPSQQTAQERATDVDDRGVASQVLLLRSRSLVQKVIEKLELNQKAEFIGSNRGSLFTNIATALGLTDHAKLVPLDDRVMDAFFERLTVYQAEGARVIIVEFWSEDAQTAAAAANALANEYVAMQERLKRGVEGDGLDKLKPELEALRQSVLKAEEAVADFRAESNLLQGSNNNTLAGQELSELSTELGRVRADLSKARANARSIRSALQSGALDRASSVISSPLVQRLRERLIGLKGQLSDLSTTLLNKHPRIISTRRQIRDLEDEIAREARKIETSLQDEVKVAKSREVDLLARHEVLKKEANRVDKAQVELRALEREADAQRQLLNQYLVRFKEAQGRHKRDFLPADVLVFSTADVASRPYFPRIGPTLIGAFFGTAVMGSVIALSASILSGAAIVPAASAVPNAPLAPVPAQNGMQPRVMRESNISSLQGRQFAQEPVRTEENTFIEKGAQAFQETTQAFQQTNRVPPSVSSTHERFQSAPPITPHHADLAKPLLTPLPYLSQITTSMTKILHWLDELGKARIVALTPSALDGSEQIVALVRSLSKAQKSVIMVDLTGRGSATLAMLENHQVRGIKDLMAGTCGFAQAMHRDSVSNAHIMPLGRASVQQAASNKMRLGAVLEVLEQAYDYVVLDCGTSDTAGISRVADHNAFNIVMAGNNSDEQMLEQACALFADQGLGVPFILEAQDQQFHGAQGMSA